MIVVYNALSVRPGVFDGAATFSLNIVPELARALPDDEITVLVRASETRLGSGGNLRVQSVALPAHPAARAVYESFGLSRTLRRERADVLVSPNESVPFRAPCAVIVVAQNLVYHRDGWRLAFQGGRPLERAASHAQAAYYRWSMPRAYRRSERVAAVSETTARLLATRAGLDPAKTRVVYEGSDSGLLPPPRDGIPREPRLLVVSTLAPYKGLERALQLFAGLRGRLPELQLDLVGADWRGYRASLESLADRLGVSDAVHFLGSLGGGELADRYERSLALVHLSECESFGLPLVEAMRYGLPVVSSGRSSLAEVAGGAALELSEDRDAATHAVLEILVDGPAREELVGRGRVRAAELTWRDAGEKLAGVAREAFERR